MPTENKYDPAKEDEKHKLPSLKTGHTPDWEAKRQELEAKREARRKRYNKEVV